MAQQIVSRRTKTVEVNLSRIYRKLDIRSRIELYKAFGTPNLE